MHQWGVLGPLGSVDGSLVVGHLFPNYTINFEPMGN